MKTLYHRWLSNGRGWQACDSPHQHQASLKCDPSKSEHMCSFDLISPKHGFLKLHCRFKIPFRMDTAGNESLSFLGLGCPNYAKIGKDIQEIGQSTPIPFQANTMDVAPSASPSKIGLGHCEIRNNCCECGISLTAGHVRFCFFRICGALQPTSKLTSGADLQADQTRVSRVARHAFLLALLPLAIHF